MKRTAPLLFALGLILTAAPSPKTNLGALEIAPVEIPDGIQLPENFKSAMERHLIDQMEKTHRFSSVFAGGGRSVGADGPKMRLTITLSSFKKGSRGERYLLGPAFGNTVMKAHVRFVDVATGNVRAEKDIGGRVAIGLFGGDSAGATNGVAKGAASLVKKQL